MITSWVVMGLIGVIPARVAISVFTVQPTHRNEMREVLDVFCRVRGWDVALLALLLLTGPFGLALSLTGCVASLIGLLVYLVLLNDNWFDRTLFRICPKREDGQD